VAVVERPASAAVAAASPESRDDGSAPRVDADADAAWLAGVPVYEPPPDPEGAPEPPPEPSFEAAEPERRPAGPRVRETPRQSAERQSRQESARSGSAAPDDMDESSADDPDITSTGLVGVPLVVQVLGGKVIDEVVEGQ
jgi:DNA polymerase-3 subunit gamma/tau